MAGSRFSLQIVVTQDRAIRHGCKGVAFLAPEQRLAPLNYQLLVHFNILRCNIQDFVAAKTIVYWTDHQMLYPNYAAHRGFRRRSSL